MNVEFKWDTEKYKQMVDGCKDNPTTPYIFKYLSKDSRVLEAGCGLGHYVNFLSKLGYNIFGVEISKDSVKFANENNKELKIISSNIEQMPFDDNYFSGVICLGVVEHIVEGPEKALAEIFRVMKPNGVGIISVPVFNTIRKIKYYSGIAFLDFNLRNFYYKFLKKNVDWINQSSVNADLKNYHKWPYSGGFFEYRFTSKQISQKLREAGFSIVEEVPLEGMGGFYHEFGGVLVNNKILKPVFVLLDKLLSHSPFFHQHTYLAIVHK